MKKFMNAKLFNEGLIRVESDYARISKFYGSERRTGHRWTIDGPSNQVAVTIKLLSALGLTIEDAKFLMDLGERKSGTKLPAVVLDISASVALMQSQQRQRASEKKAARGGAKGSSDGDRQSKRGAPAKGRPRAAAA
jgi:hypothetical protein